MFLVLVAAQNFNPSWDGLSGNRILLFLAAENLKKRFPLFRSWDGLIRNRVFNVRCNCLLLAL